MHGKNNASNALDVPSAVQRGTSSACDEKSQYELSGSRKLVRSSITPTMSLDSPKMHRRHLLPTSGRTENDIPTSPVQWHSVDRLLKESGQLRPDRMPYKVRNLVISVCLWVYFLSALDDQTV